MSFGGHISAMISSLRNNRELLKRLKERRSYAYNHGMEAKKRKYLKIKSYPQKIIESIKNKSRKEYLFEVKRERIIIFSIVVFGLIVFPIYLKYLGVF